MTEHINEYRQIIERFARERINQRVPNGLAEHASVLLETMFRHATAEIRIFTGELAPIVYGSDRLIEAAKSFLASKSYSTLRILVQKEHTPEWACEQPLLKSLSEMRGTHGRVDVQCAAGAYASDQALHFAVMDNDGYRFELNHGKCKAVANFNEPKVARDLIKAFDKAFSLGKQMGAPVLFELKAV